MSREKPISTSPAAVASTPAMSARGAPSPALGQTRHRVPEHDRDDGVDRVDPGDRAWVAGDGRRHQRQRDRELRGHELMTAHEAGVGQKWPIAEGELQTAEGPALLRDLHGRQPEQNHDKDQDIACGADQRDQPEIDPEQQRPELGAGGDAESRHDSVLAK